MVALTVGQGSMKLRDNRFDFSTERYETQGRYICLLHREV